MDNHTTVSVGIGQIYATRDSSLVLAAFGLGSCVGLSLFDPMVKCGGMAHVLLPSSKEAGYQATGFRFADTAISALVQELAKLGGAPRRMICKIAGGAQVIVAPGHLDGFRIGERNVEAVKDGLRQFGIAPMASDTGGSKGRTLRLFVATGQVLVRTAGRGDVEI